MTTVPSHSLQRLLDEEPFVRLLAHSLLAEEADEAVQQTWLRAVRDGGASVVEPRSWLARILFHAAHSLRREEHRRERHERAVQLATSVVPSPAELLEREESRRMLVVAVNELPAHLRTAVLMRYFDGLPPRHIAGQLGLPVTTVWNQLRRALQLLRERLDAQHDGGRRAWLLPLIPFANGGPVGPSMTPGPVAARLSDQGKTLPMQAKLTAAAAFVLVGLGGVTIWATSGSGTTPELANEPASKKTAVAAAPMDPVRSEAGLQRTLALPGTTASVGAALVVHVRHADDATAAVGVTVLVMPVVGDRRVDALRRRTDERGEARFEALPAGSFRVGTDRSDDGKKVDLDGKKTIDLDYDLPIGVTLTGIVVDRTGAPVPRALLDLAPLGSVDTDAETVAVAGEDGRFMVRSASFGAGAVPTPGPVAVFLGARANGHASSPLQLVTAQPRATVELRLQLGTPAGTVSGVVVDAQGGAVPRAILRIGSGLTTGLAGASGVPPVPATVHTDEEGKFVALGIPPGTQPIVARAATKAPWRGTCAVTANTTTSLRIELGDGATIRGTVRDTEGSTMARAEVEVGNVEDLAHYRGVTSKDGEFQLTGLPVGDVKIAAQHHGAGRAERLVKTTAGNVARCDLQLSLGLLLRGRVVDDAGAPVAKAMLDCVAVAAKWAQRAVSDADGRFVVPNCPANVKLSIMVRGNGIQQRNAPDVDPSAGPLELRVTRSTGATVKIRGSVVDHAGKPLADVSVRASNGHVVPGPTRFEMTGADGRFELGPLVPGTWSVWVRSPLYPPFQTAPRDLAANAVWDLEPVQLVAGGTVRVRVDGDLAAVRFVVVDGADNVVSSFSDSGPTPLVSSPLLPGAYRLCVSSETVTADAVPFTAGSGKEAAVSLQLQTGVRQRIEVAADALAALPDRVTLRVHRGTTLVTVTTYTFRQTRRPAKELCLLPGDYRIAVFDGDRELVATKISVASSGSAPVQLELR